MWTKLPVSTTTPTTSGSKIKGKVMNCLGDSITNGFGTSKVYHSYIKDIAELSLVRNYGISGNRLSGASGMCERYVNMENNADIVTVLGGINDANNASWPLGDFTSRDISNFYGGLHVLFKGLREKYPAPTTKIIVFTLMHHSSPDPYDATKYARVKSFADATIEVARFYQLPCLDLFGCSEVPPIELHPTAEYHEMMAKKMLSFIEAQF